MLYCRALCKCHNFPGTIKPFSSMYGPGTSTIIKTQVSPHCYPGISNKQVCILFLFFWRYTGLDAKPGAFQTSSEDEKYLKMLMTKIQERNVVIRKSIVERDDDEDEESGSGSASGGNLLFKFMICMELYAPPG